jgi:hypothetical protein
MKLQRASLIAFFGNYLINNVVAAIAAFIPAGTGTITTQYVVFIILSAILTGLMAWWYLKRIPSSMGLKAGTVFGILGFVIAIATAFVTGVSGVLIQTASFSTLWSVLPNFGPFIWSWSTLVLLGYWFIPALLVGWLVSRRSTGTPSAVPHMNTMPSSQSM